MKKIFILTGEASGDKLASKVISKLKKDNLDIDYLSVGGESLKALGIKSIYNLKEITYIGFTNVISNIFKINKKIKKKISVVLITSDKCYKNLETKKAYKENRSIIDVASEETDLTKAKLMKLLDPSKLAKGGL